MPPTNNHRIVKMTFTKVYPMYVQKAERKGRSKEEVDEIIRWLTGYDQAGLERQIGQSKDFEAFFAEAPAMNANTSLIKGVVMRLSDPPETAAPVRTVRAR